MSNEFNPVPVDPSRYTETLQAAIDEADRGEVVRRPIEFLDDGYPHSTATDHEPIEDTRAVLDAEGVDTDIYLPPNGQVD